MKKDYTKFPDKQLDDILKDLKFQLIRSHPKLVEGVKKKYSHKEIRKEIARIKTEQTRRLKKQ